MELEFAFRIFFGCVGSNGMFVLYDAFRKVGFLFAFNQVPTHKTKGNLKKRTPENSGGGMKALLFHKKKVPDQIVDRRQ